MRWSLGRRWEGGKCEEGRYCWQPACSRRGLLPRRPGPGSLTPQRPERGRATHSPPYWRQIPAARPVRAPVEGPQRLPIRQRPGSLPPSSSLAPLSAPPTLGPESICPCGEGGKTAKVCGALRTGRSVSLWAEGLQGFDLAILGFQWDFTFSFKMKARCRLSHSLVVRSLGTSLLWCGMTQC